jgi:hypothetical protein
VGHAAWNPCGAVAGLADSEDLLHLGEDHRDDPFGDFSAGDSQQDGVRGQAGVPGDLAGKPATCR